MNKAVLLFTLIITILSASCSLNVDDIPKSGTFSEGSHTYRLWLPPNFEDEYMLRQKLPLVIALHGRTSLTNHYYQPCIVNNQAEYETYPCVYFAPNNSDQGFDDNAAWIRDTINRIILDRRYRIDINRIYIIGFSMGAHGTTYMAQDLYDEYGYLVAGIIPADGGIYNSITSSIVRDNISYWVHYGAYNQESDYQAAKTYHSSASETIETGSITYSSWNNTTYTYDWETKTLVKEGIEIFKITKYDGMGHTDGPVYEDPNVLEWLFDQNIQN